MEEEKCCCADSYQAGFLVLLLVVIMITIKLNFIYTVKIFSIQYSRIFERTLLFLEVSQDLPVFPG